MPVIETPRLLLRHWRDSDIEPWVAMNADPRVTEFFSTTYTRAIAESTAAVRRRELDELGHGWWVVEVRGGAPFTGVIALRDVPFQAHFTPAWEVGWRFAPEFWGNGYATEGARAALDFGFERLALPEIVAMTAVANLRSQRVMQRLGMTHDPADDFDHPKMKRDIRSSGTSCIGFDPAHEGARRGCGRFHRLAPCGSLFSRRLERRRRHSMLTGDERNLAAALESKRFALLQRDIASERESLADDIEQLGEAPDLILHFASPASPVNYFEHPVATMAANSAGTLHCLQAAQRWNCRFLYASTSESYGDPLVHPQREDYWGNVNPVGPRSCYDESKRFGEALTMAFARSAGVDVRIIRIFNTYGPRMRHNDGRVVSNFIVAALRGEPLTIYGDGRQTRSFCYVDDLVEGIVRCAASEKTKSRVVNLGNPEEHTVNELAELIATIVERPLRIERRPAREDDPARRQPDIGLARELLDWEPTIACADGLRKTVEFFRA